MKKNRLISSSVFVMSMAVLSSMMLLSCGNGGNSEKRSDSVPADAIFGDLGSEFVDLYYKPSVGDMKSIVVKEVQEYIEKKHPGVTNSNTSREELAMVYNEMNDEIEKRWKELDYESQKPKWDQRLVEVEEELKTKEVPVEVGEGVPLKVVSPCKIENIDRQNITITCMVELTEDKKMKIVSEPNMSFIDDSGKAAWSVRMDATGISGLPNGLKAGTQMKLSYRISTFHKDHVNAFFSAKRLELGWPLFVLENGKLGPIEIGIGYTNLPKSVANLYDNWEYKKETIENEMDGDYTVEYCMFTKGDQELFRADIEDGKVAAITLLQGSFDIKNEEGCHVGGFVSKIPRWQSEWENYYEGEVFITIGRYTYYVPSDMAKVEYPKSSNDFKNGAKISKIVCR